MANYRVICKSGHTLYLTDIASVAWVTQAVKCKEYRNEFGMASVKNGPGAGSETLAAGQTVQLTDPDNIPASVNGTTYIDAIILDDAMAGITPRADDINITMRRYTPTSGPTYDVPLSNWAGESNEVAA